MKIQVSTRHGQLSEASQQKISAKAEKLTRIFDRLTSIDVVVDLSDEANPKVDLKVSAEHKHDFMAHDQSESLMGSLDAAFNEWSSSYGSTRRRCRSGIAPGDPRRQEVLKPEAE